MTDLARWNKLQIGTPITGFSGYNTNCIDNLQVISVGYDWAVLRNLENGNVCRCILEPDDDFLIGEHLWNEVDGGYYFSEV